MAEQETLKKIGKVQDAIQLEDSIRWYVTKKLIGVEKGWTIQESVARMVEFDISSIAVIEEGKVIGFLTDSDIKKRVVAGGVSPQRPIGEVMTRDLITLDINATVRDALSVMSGHTIKHVLITDNGDIVGIMTLSDIEDLGRQRLETHIARE